MTLQLTPTQILAALGALLVLGMVWRVSLRTARRTADTARNGARFMSLTGRIVLTAGGIVGLQWIVITHPGNTTLLLVVLGLPALISSYTLTRALTVSTTDVPQKKSGRR